MAGEVQLSGPGTGRTLYFTIRNRIGQIWDTVDSAFETYDTAAYANYDVALAEQGTASNIYVGTFPSAIPAGIYSLVAKQQLGGSIAETDTTVATGDFHWNGTVSVPLADLATSGQVGAFLPIRATRGIMIPHFHFSLVSSADHITPLTSGVCSGQIVKDNGTFGVIQSGTLVAGYTEIGLGVYRTTLTSGDLTANFATLNIQAVGVSGGAADPKYFHFLLQRSSGQTIT